MKRKKTEVISLRRISAAVKMFSEKIYSDHITLYAAQSSFFTMIATIPFLMLLITLIRIVFPDAIDSVFIELERILPEKFSPLFSTVYTEISSKNTASVLSFSAITMFWSSSRGVAAVTRGVAGVYGTRDHVGFFSELVRSLFYTVAFMALIIATLVVLVFGATVRSIAESSFPAALHIFDLIIRLRMFIFVCGCLYSLRCSRCSSLSCIPQSPETVEKTLRKMTKPPSDTDVRYPARSSQRRAGCCIRISILCISSTSRMHRTFTEAWRRSFSSCFGFTSV